MLGGVFFLPLCLNAALTLLLAAGLLFAGRMAWTGEIVIRRTKLDPWLAGFALLAAASAPGSIFAYESWYNYYHLVTLYLLVYFLVVQTTLDETDLHQVVSAILASAAIVCVIGLFQYAVGVDVTAERWIDGDRFPQLKTRVFSTLGNPNVLAAFLVMILGIAVGWSTDQSRGGCRIALRLLTLLTLVCLALTFSRGAWVAAGAMLLISAGVWRRPGPRFLLGIILVMAALAFLAHEALTVRLLSIFGMFHSHDSSVALRWALWESTLAMITEQPWLGIGWGVYCYVYPYYDFFVKNDTVMIYHAHNTILSLAAEIGIPGMLCFVTACGTAAAKMLRQLNTAAGNRGLPFGMLLSMAGLAIFSLTDHVLFNLQVMAVFWALLAVAACMPDNSRSSRPAYWLYKK